MMNDFELALYATFIGWCFGFTTYALMESFRILKEMKSRNR